MPLQTNITLGTQVLAKNVGSVPYVGAWNSVEYRVLPGESLHIPFELAKKDFGDPRSTGDVRTVKDSPGSLPQFISDRLTEARRLHQQWLPSEFGTNKVRFREFLPGDRSAFADGISDTIPRVEIYALTGERILMVADDPYGDNVLAPVNPQSQEAALHAMTTQQSSIIAQQQEMLEQMKRDMEMMRQELGRGQSEPIDLGPDLPLGRSTSPAFQDPSPTPPVGNISTDPSTPPAVQLNPRTGRISRKKDPVDTPTSLEDVPSDFS